MEEPHNNRGERIVPDSLATGWVWLHYLLLFLVWTKTDELLKGGGGREDIPDIRTPGTRRRCTSRRQTRTRRRKRERERKETERREKGDCCCFPLLWPVFTSLWSLGVLPVLPAFLPLLPSFPMLQAVAPTNSASL